MPQFESTDSPRDVRIEEEKHTFYVELSSDSRSPFENAQFKDIFVFAMAYGFRHGHRVPLEGETRALINRSSLSEAQQWIVKSVAMKEVEDGQILQDGSQIYDIAHAYANGGIKELYKSFKGPGDSFRELSSEVIEEYQSLEE